MYKKSRVKKNILVAGIAGASLGTEILKSLLLTNKYNIFGTDISSHAYGLYHGGFIKTFIVDLENYIEDTISIAKQEKIDVIIPGGEKPLQLFNEARDLFEKEKIALAINNTNVIDLCTDKNKTFTELKKLGIPIPRTEFVSNKNQLIDFPYPCILKPSTGSGGSVSVYLANNENEAVLAFQTMQQNNIPILIQEYIPYDANEYTVGVLSLQNGTIVKSIAMKRLFPSKLSYVFKQENQIISSGYSQGEFAEFTDICLQSEQIAHAINSSGPLNIQGRMKDNIFYPFEINPRFSATTHLRALAGFNELDIYIQYLCSNNVIPSNKIKYGYYLRSLEEHFIPKEEILND